MAGSITLALLSAQTALASNQLALDATTNNVANVNSPGYSRKIVHMESRNVNGAGAGVQVGEIVRRVDEGLLRSLRLEISQTSEYDSQSLYYERLQELFGSPADNSSLSHIITNMTDSMKALAASPEKTLEQSDLIRWADETIYKLQQMDGTIQELRFQADKAIGDEITEINEIIQRIGDTNNKIVRNSAYSNDVTDLQDQRDQDLDRLAQMIDIRYFTREDGDVVVFTASGRTLVDNIETQFTHTSASNVNSTFTHAGGNFDGIYAGTRSDLNNDITNDLSSGTLRGLVELRDSILPNMQSQIDELAAQMRDVVNQVHNRGIPYPGLNDVTGTRSFIDSATQTITMDSADGSDDVAIALLDNDGVQLAATTLETIMTSAVYGSGAQAANGPWTIDEVAATMKEWFNLNGAPAATVSVNDEGKFAINMNSTTLNFGFRDQASSTLGSDSEDASIEFDANGDGVTDKTVFGFSNFLGLNDFFVDGLPDNLYDTDVLSGNFAATDATLTFRDDTGSILDKDSNATFTIAAGESLSTIAANINAAYTDIKATVIPDGSGWRLRIAHDGGKDMTITQAAADTFLDDIGMDTASVRTADTLAVRSDIRTTPGLISRGAVQWDATLGGSGQFYSSVGDNEIIQAMADRMTDATAFRTAGGITSNSVSFEVFASSILSKNSSMADTNKVKLEYQESLTNSLRNKSDNFRGVNLDEEMSQLLLYEQGYIAATRVISTINKMIDALENIL